MLEDRIRRIMGTVFNLPPEDLGPEPSVDATAGWDSVAHLDLVISLEEHFGISLAPEEVPAMTSFRTIVDVLRRHGVEE